MKMYRPHRLCPRNSKPKEPSLYRSLCVSILCMFLSTVMLVGTTMAWFSDSLQTGVYTITSADFSTTVYYCTDLAGESGTNNWQRLNPGNTTMFGGGSLSGSSSYQTAYLKIVNASNIDLEYTLTITGEPSTGGEGSSPLPLSLAFEAVADEAGLKTAFTSTDESSTQSGENTSTSTEISFTVPQTTTKFVALKLSLNTSATGSDASSTNSEQKATPCKFSLQLKITQTHPDAQAAEPEPPVIIDVNMDITGSTASTPDTTASDPANSSGEVTQQPADENSSDTNNTETPSGSTTGTENATETPESGNGGNPNPLLPDPNPNPTPQPDTDTAPPALGRLP